MSDNNGRSRIVIGLVAGVIFGIGLVIAGMAQPAKVAGFLDVFGAWDPSLALVMVGAIGVHMAFLRLIAKRPTPIFAERFTPSAFTEIDARLIGGAVLFGIGWGLSGICPGPGIVVLADGLMHSVWPVVAFVAAMCIALKLTPPPTPKA